MKLLIDSSSSYLFLAIINNDQINTFYRLGHNDHSETMVDIIADFLNKKNIKTEDITQIYVGRGPGSYTGIRIAGVVGKVFSNIQNIPLYSFSSLDMLIASVIEIDGKYLAKIGAKKNYSYVKVVNITNTNIEVILNDHFIIDEELNKYANYQIIEINEDLFSKTEQIAKNIIKFHLYQIEDNILYVPNYLREGI